MPMKFEFTFSKSHRPAGGSAVLLQVAGAKEPAGVAVVDPEGVLPKAAKIGKFSGKALSSLDIVAPHGSPADRIILLGLGDAAALTSHDWLKAGGAGCITATSNLVGDSLRLIFDHVSDPAKAAEVEAAQARINAYRTLSNSYVQIPTIKAMVAFKRNEDAWFRTRAPLVPLNESERADLAAKFAALD